MQAPIYGMSMVQSIIYFLLYFCYPASTTSAVEMVMIRKHKDLYIEMQERRHMVTVYTDVYTRSKAEMNVQIHASKLF